MMSVKKFMEHWRDRKMHVPPPTPPPRWTPPPVRGPACVLYLSELSALSEALKSRIETPVTGFSTASLLNVLNNSAIVPPVPWPQTPHRFDSMIQIPSTLEKGQAIWVPAFVFYPL